MHHEGFSACPPRKILFFKQQSSHIVEEASSSQGVLGGIFAWSSHNLTQSHMNSHMMPSTSQFCLTHGGHCSLMKDMSGLPCEDNSRANCKRRFLHGNFGSVYLLWAKHHRAMRTPVVLLENTPELWMVIVEYLLVSISLFFFGGQSIIINRTSSVQPAHCLRNLRTSRLMTSWACWEMSISWSNYLLSRLIWDIMGFQDPERTYTTTTKQRLTTSLTFMTFTKQFAMKFAKLFILSLKTTWCQVTLPGVVKRWHWQEQGIFLTDM